MTTEKLKLFLGGLRAKRIDVWFFYGFLITFPLSIRKVLTFYPIKGAFNEYTGIYLYLSDLFLLATLALWGITILCNNWQYLSIFSFSGLKESLLFKKWLTIRINPLIILPLLLVIWSLISIIWAPNQHIALFRSAKLLEFFLLYLYIRLNFQNVFQNKLFHGEQNIQNKISENCSTGNKCNLNYLDQNRVFRNFILIFSAIGLFEALLAFLQIVNSGSIGLYFLKESLFNLSMTGVAKITLGDKPFIRPYGLFPHPNILGAYLLISTVLAFWYFRLTQANKANCSTGNNFQLLAQKFFQNLKKIFFSLRNIFCSTWNKIKNSKIFSKLFHAHQDKCFTWNIFFGTEYCAKKKLLCLTLTIFALFATFGLYWALIAFPGNANNGLNAQICQLSTQPDQIQLIGMLPISCQVINGLGYKLMALLVALAVIASILAIFSHILTDRLFVKQFLTSVEKIKNVPRLFNKMFHVEHFAKNEKFNSGKNLICSTWNKIGNSKTFTNFKNIFLHACPVGCSTWNIPTGVEQSTLKATLYSLIWVFPLLALFLTFSKNAIIGLSIAIFAIGYQRYLAKNGCSTLTFAYLKPFLRDKVLTTRNILLLAILLMVLVNMHPSMESLFSRSLDDRLIFQNVSRGTISNNLVLGVGIGQFIPTMDRYSKMPLLPWQYQPVHNVFSLIWSELGLIGLLLFIGFIFAIFRSFRDTLGDNPQLIHKKAVFRGLFVAFLFMLLFDHYFWDIQQGMALWWIILAFV